MNQVKKRGARDQGLSARMNVTLTPAMLDELQQEAHKADTDVAKIVRCALVDRKANAAIRAALSECLSLLESDYTGRDGLTGGAADLSAQIHAALGLEAKK